MPSRLQPNGTVRVAEVLAAWHVRPIGARRAGRVRVLLPCA